MGGDPAALPPKPPLLQFYSTIMDAVEAGQFMAWGIISPDDKYVGHTILDKSTGEWEMGTVLVDESLWGSGIGVRAALTALKWAFEEDDAEWVISFVNSKDPRVERIVQKGGFRKLLHFWVMDKPTWDAKWRSRMDR